MNQMLAKKLPPLCSLTRSGSWTSSPPVLGSVWEALQLEVDQQDRRTTITSCGSKMTLDDITILEDCNLKEMLKKNQLLCTQQTVVWAADCSLWQRGHTAHTDGTVASVSAWLCLCVAVTICLRIISVTLALCRRCHSLCHCNALCLHY